MIVATKVDEHTMKAASECAFCNAIYYQKYDVSGFRWDMFLTTEGTDEESIGFLVCNCCRRDACILNLVNLLGDPDHPIYFKCSNHDSILYDIDYHTQYNY